MSCRRVRCRAGENRLRAQAARAPGSSAARKASGEAMARIPRWPQPSRPLAQAGAFGVLEFAVFLHDERAAERNHHQDAEQSAEHRHEHHAADFPVEPENHDGRHRDAEAERDGFTGRAGGLDDVVFENALRRVRRPSTTYERA